MESVQEQPLAAVKHSPVQAPPPVQRRDRAIAAAARRLQRRRDEVADAVLRACRETVPAYVSVEDRHVLDDLGRTCAEHVDGLLSVLSGEPLTTEQFRELISVGERRARQGVPLRHVLHAYQVGTRVALDYLLDELRLDLDVRARLDYERMVSRLVHTVFDLSTRTSSAVADLYALTDRRSVAFDADALLRQILDPDSTIDEASEAAAALGLPLESWYASFIVATDGEAVDEALRARLFDALNKSARSHVKPVVRAVTREGVAVFIVAVEVAAAVTKVGRLLRATLPDDDATHAIVGMAGRGVPGIRESYRQALAAQALFDSIGRPAAVITYEHTLPHLLLRNDPARAAEVMAATVGPLIAHDRMRSRDPLIPVLQSYVELGGRRHLIARRMHLSTRTIDRRLARIESMTGRSLSNSNDLLLIGLGLAAMDLTKA